jgi:hypothetical protein
VASLVSALGRRSIVLIGLMGSGKTSIDRRLALARSLFCGLLFHEGGEFF